MENTLTDVFGLTRPLREEDRIFYAIDPFDAHNWLDESEYDEKHGVDASGHIHLANAYLNRVGGEKDLAILEVGCGSGYLTVGLDASPCVNRLVAADISQKFLTQTRGRLPSRAGGKTALICADVTDTSLFEEGAFDAAFGNSILHHIYDYEGFLGALRHVVKPGGVVVFSEPCQQGKSLVSFFCAAMMQFDKACAIRIFSDHDYVMIAALLEINKREEEVRLMPERKLEWEDKHCFDTIESNNVALRVGFSNFESFNTQPIMDGLRGEVAANLKLVGVNRSLGSFSGLFDAFQSEYVSMCESYVQTPHQMLVFTH